MILCTVILLKVTLRGTAPPTPKLACFVHYLKITIIFLKKNIHMYASFKFSKELKKNIKI